MTINSQQRSVLGMRVDATCYVDTAQQITKWAAAGESRYVCVCNVHMIMEGHDDPRFLQVINGADLVTPDGMPVVWALRRLGFPQQTRVYGPDLTLAVCAAAEQQGVPIGLYGSTSETLAALTTAYRDRFPKLRIAYSHAPPFRPQSEAEDAAIVQAINNSGAKILLVGLGCPKQERWVASHRGRVQAVMLAVGAAFDFHSGRVRQAPHWMRRAGLEWLFRLLREPRRLWRRYLKHNPRFVWLVWRQLRTGR